ncbi:Protein of unknown function (DUF3052) [Haloactinopolyspora alba]|uniref:DUF3052 family protein n=1 Tax=Haloactinopolyspora alba TaxID=648780 RepID=A0A2P8E023_9ACTN|nr:DUF3052 domain-containing protein [Haloactinopolyspora alba]PSL02799.1 Protein of unknown function (DUF3052) [Haloactinopolyspora alba]
MGQIAGHSDQNDGPAARLGFRPSQVVQELGWDEDADDDLRIDIEDVTGNELTDESSGEVADAVLQWWRDDDGDLADALVDATRDLAAGGVVWLLTPKVGRDGHVEASDIADAALTAGLSTTTTVSATEEWSGTKLVAPKGSSRR